MDCARYTPSDAARWDEFVARARNSTFLFRREYMDYHSDRFTDHSLIFSRGSKICGLLPANLTPDGVLYSHQGLTYGGFILPQRHINGEDVLEMADALHAHCRAEGIGSMVYKALPYIYASAPSQEDLYALFRLGATPLRTELSSAILMTAHPGAAADTRRRTSKAMALNPVIDETRDVAPFWQMLSDCLDERHNAVPVHTAAELQLLMDRFPDNIRLHSISLDGQLMAGVCIYDTGQVAHAQYTASTAEGRRLSMVFALYQHLITQVYTDRSYFDFGISNEDGGLFLNTGLLRQKSLFGATGVAHQTFLVEF